ncbi:MAG: DCC1-like thiol-disulfide oxidoreductase family protein [Pseudomonadota bacterium]
MPDAIPVDALSGASRDKLKGHDVVVFDGVCVLCSGFFRFVYRHDRAQRFRFLTAQSALGGRLYRDLGLPDDDFETNLVIVDGKIYQHLGAFAAAMRALNWPWRAAAIVDLLPERLARFLYDRIAKNRYAVFGRYDVCPLPDPAMRARFLDDG